MHTTFLLLCFAVIKFSVTVGFAWFIDLCFLGLPQRYWDSHMMWGNPEAYMYKYYLLAPRHNKTQQSATWWRHQMETSSALLAICVGNSPVPGEFPSQRPVTRSFDVFFGLRLNKRLSKQWWGWWFEALSRPLWCHRNETGAYFLRIRWSCNASLVDYTYTYVLAL